MQGIVSDERSSRTHPSQAGDDVGTAFTGISFIVAKTRLLTAASAIDYDS